MKTSEQIAKVFKIDYPIDAPIIVTQPFGVNYVDFYQKLGLKGHNGIDFKAENNTPVFAVSDGVITVAYNGDPTDTTKGRYVKYETAPFQVGDEQLKLSFIYYHLAHTNLKVGDKVTKGQFLGLSDNTGLYTTGPHLHFGMLIIYTNPIGFQGIIDNGYGGTENPQPLFNSITPYKFMVFKKEKSNPHIYFINGSRKIMVVDMPTLMALKDSNDSIQIVNDGDLKFYQDGGTFVFVERIIN